MSDSQSALGSTEQAGGDSVNEEKVEDETPVSDAQEAAQDETASAEDGDVHSNVDHAQESGQQSRTSGVEGEESAVSMEQSSRGDLGRDGEKEGDGEERGGNDDVDNGDGRESEVETSEDVEEGEGTKGEDGYVNTGDREEEGVVGHEERDGGMDNKEEEERGEHGDTVGEGGVESRQNEDEKESEDEYQQPEEQAKTADLDEGATPKDRVVATEALESLDSSMAAIAESEESDEDDDAEGEGPPPIEDPVEPAQFVLRQPPEDDFNLEPEFDENEMLFAASVESAHSFVMRANAAKEEAVVDEVEAAQVKALPSLDREQYYELCRAQHAQQTALRRRNAVLQKKLMLHFKRRKSKDVFKEEETTSAEMEAKYARKLSQFGQAQTEDADARRLAADAVDALDATNARLDAELRTLLDAFVDHERDTCAAMVSPKTGKPLSERLVERLLRRQRDAVDAGAATLRAYIRQGARVRDLENAILALEDLGQNLKIVDYEQLRLENQNLADKLEERDDELARFRARGLHSLQAMSHFRQKAVGVNEALEQQLDKLRRGQEELDVARSELNSLKATRDRLRADYSRDSAQCGLLTKPQLLRDFERTLDECDGLRAQLCELRAEIALEQRQLEAIRALGPGTRHAIEPRISIMGSVQLRGRRTAHAQNVDTELCEGFANAFV